MDRKVTIQKLTGYSKSKGINYVILHKKKYDLLRNTYVSPELNLLQRILIASDFVWCIVRYGAGINDYFQYQLFNKNPKERETFIVARKWMKIIKRCNGQIKQPDFDDKANFNSLYSEFLGRDWLDTDSCSKQDFIHFIDKHKESIAKIKEGSGGNGIFVYKRDDALSLDEDFTKLRNNHIILEEIIHQHKSLAEFNPSSVNTLRLVTITHNGKVSLMNAVLRMGNGEGCTDNFHHLGIAALVNTENGIVCTPGVDKNNIYYSYHPGSGKQIEGFQIPYWESIVETVEKAALVSKQVRYVGWDIAIKDDGTICIIEGNCSSDPDIIQIPDQVGKWPAYKKVLNEL